MANEQDERDSQRQSDVSPSQRPKNGTKKHDEARKSSSRGSAKPASSKSKTPSASKPKKGPENQRQVEDETASVNLNFSEDEDEPIRIDRMVSLSDSESDSDFLGFVPIQRKRKSAQIDDVPVTDTDTTGGSADAAPSTSTFQGYPMAMPMQMAVPANFGQFPQHFPMPMMYWPCPMPAQDPNQFKDNELTEPEEGEISEDEGDANGVSLDEHLKEAEEPEDVGAPVTKKVATYATKIWNKPAKNIKELYTKHQRPSNVPCLQRVEMDEELFDALPQSLKAKQQDFALKGLNNIFVHAAIVSTELLQIALTADRSDDIRQKIVNTTVDAMKMLAYGAQTTNSLRKEQLKPVLNPLIKRKLCSKKNSVAEMNETHCLFGGDVPGIVKRGT